MKSLGIAALVAVTSVTCGRAADVAGPVRAVPVASIVRVGGYTIDLGAPDDPKAPRAWEGPLRVTSMAGQRCDVSDDVGIVEQPLELMRGHFLYVPTYSGSESTLFVVNLTNCGIAWTSPHYEGAVVLSARRLRLPGGRSFSIDAEGLPAPRS